MSSLKPRLRFSRLHVASVFLIFSMMGVIILPHYVHPYASAAGVSVTVNPTQKYQTIGGLGVNANVHNWNGGQLKPAIDAIAGTMGASTYRVEIDRCDFEATNDDADPTHFNWTYYNSVYSTGKMADLWATIAYLNSKNLQVSLDCMGGTPLWMGGTSVSATAINSNMEDEWVEMIASMVYYGRVTKGLQFTLLAPANEIDLNGNEGPLIGPAQYARLMHKLSVKLDGLGLSDIRFVGPDLAYATNFNNYYSAVSADSVVMGKMAHFGAHSYDGGLGSIPATIAPSGKDLWMTEFSGPCPNCDNGAPNPSDWSSAKITGQYLATFLDNGATGAQVYDGWDGYYEHHGSMGYWGTEAEDTTTGTYTPRKSFYVLAQYYKFIPPGSVRVGVTSSSASIDVQAFQDPATKRLSVVGFNTSTSAQTISVAIGDPAVTTVDFYKTNATANLAATTGIAVTSGYATITVPADTEFTVTGVPATAATPTPTVQSTPTPTTSAALPGDVNLDGKVNITDLSMLLSRWATTDAAADFNHDSTVNIMDLSILLSHWTG